MSALRSSSVLALLALTTAPMLACSVNGKTNVRASGQSSLMDSSFAAQCNPDDDTKPFVIEWDATDMSSFESLAAKDVVMVKYEGCKLKVLDECTVATLRSESGTAYDSPQWTSGSLETLDIHNQGELAAKLPLAQGTLGVRVAGGEQFHMEYYVSGTVNAGTDAVYRGDLASNPMCEAATHFVYGYNLGAFALGSAADLSAGAGGSVYGFGAGGSLDKGRTAEKKAGDLTACAADTTGEQPKCKTPIRLNLRSIRDGERG